MQQSTIYSTSVKGANYCDKECASDQGQATAIAANSDNPNHEGGPYTKRAITWLRSFRNRISRGVGDLSLVGL